MDKFIVRSATREDFPAIRALIYAVRINPLGLNWERFLVVTPSKGKLVGCGQVKPHSDGSMELASIAVQSQFRGKGLARRIIHSLIVSEQTRPLYLMCRARLELFYRKFGFYSISPMQMPPYFKRIKRADSIFRSNFSEDDRLLIMKLD